MGVPLLFIIGVGPSSSAILLLYPAVLRSGAQIIIINRDSQYSYGSDKYKGVQ